MEKWIEINIPFSDYSDDCFVKRGLNKPGVLIETKPGEELLDVKYHTETEKKRYLIGNINKVGGVCDDCMAFLNDTIVVRYKVLLSEDDINNG